MDIINFCPWEAPKFLIFSSNVPQLLFYSHFPAIITSLMLGFLVFWGDRKSFLGRLLLGLSISFSTWAFFNLILWATNRTDITIFFWSLQILVEIFIFIFSFYLVYVYIKNKFSPFKLNLFIFILVLPFILLISTKYNLLGIDLANCYATENNIIIYYSYILEILFAVLIFLLILFGYRKNAERRKEILMFSIGIILFLLAFSFGNIVGSFTEDWVVAQYGLFGMPVFIGVLGYLIVKYKTFNVKLLATQALVWGLAILIGSQFFFIKVPINFVLTGITFVSSIIFGYFLIKSVKKEIEQREQLQRLNIELEAAIQQRESLVHLVTHKVKGSFTRSKYIFAGLLDGTFGEVTPEIKKIAEQGLESDNMGIETVDLVLNVANMQKGTVKYDMKPMNLREVVEKSMSEKKIVAETKGLVIQNNIQRGAYNILGDTFWIKEVINNLLENSIKYTKTGTISVNLEKQNKKILLSVKDTGVGITPEDKANLFTEGGRGKDSVKVNIDSTGYGLYSVKLIVDAHNGRVWSESDGAGKGSTFFIELPVA